MSMVKRLYEGHKKGYKIYSNFNLSFPHEKINKKIIEEWTNSRREFEKSIIAIDELYLMIDSRGSGSKTFNKIFSYFLLQTSKINVHLFATAQYFNTIDRRFRDNVKFKCICLLKKYNVKTKEFENYEIIDRFPPKEDIKYLAIENNYYIKKIHESLNIPYWKYKKTYTNFIETKDLYNTKELIDINN